MGRATLMSAGPFVAGSHVKLTLILHCRDLRGIDDTGMLKIPWRTTSDMGKPQFDRPEADNYTTAEASNGANLDVWFDRLNIRPYANTFIVRVRPRLSARGRNPGEPCLRSPNRCFRRLRVLRATRAAGIRSDAGAGGKLEGNLAIARNRGRAFSLGDRRRRPLGQSDQDGLPNDQGGPHPDYGRRPEGARRLIEHCRRYVRPRLCGPGTRRCRPALDSCVGLASRASLLRILPKKGRGLRFDPGLTCASSPTARPARRLRHHR